MFLVFSYLISQASQANGYGLLFFLYNTHFHTYTVSVFGDIFYVTYFGVVALSFSNIIGLSPKQMGMVYFPPL